MKHVNFLPWEGENYERGFHGLKTLILGESQYGESPNPSQFTIERIQEHIDGGRRATYTKIVKALTGNDVDLAAKYQFWNSVSFYNYVQVFVEDTRIRPTDPSWKTGERPFEEVLEHLKPEFILVLGYRLWDSLPFLNSYKGPNIEGASEPTTWIYPHSSGTALAYCVKHPSSSFSPLTEHQYILTAMNKAKELQKEVLPVVCS